jgi:hypothetical protein
MAVVASTPPQIPPLVGGFTITLPPGASAGPFTVDLEFDPDPIVTSASLQVAANVSSAVDGTAQLLLDDTEFLTAPVVANEPTSIREDRDVLPCAEATCQEALVFELTNLTTADAEVRVRINFLRFTDGGMPLSVPVARLTVSDAEGQILVDERTR